MEVDLLVRIIPVKIDNIQIFNVKNIEICQVMYYLRE